MKMKICPGCQKPIPEDSALCPYCLYAFEVKKPKSKPASAPVHNQDSEPNTALNPTLVPKSRAVPKPKLPSMTLGQKPMTDPKAYSSHVHTEGTQKKTFIFKWIIIVIAIFIILAIAFNAFKAGSGNTYDSSSAIATPISESNEEMEEAAATPTPEAEMEEEIPQQVEYVIADSDSRYLTEADLEELTPEERRLARNEIYARHHRLFDDEGLQNYFNGCSWYEGIISPDDFSEAYAASVFNEYELYNKDFILAYEKEHK